MSRRVTERIKAREAQNNPATTTKLTYPEEVSLAEAAVLINSVVEPQAEVIKKPRTKKTK